MLFCTLKTEHLYLKNLLSFTQSKNEWLKQVSISKCELRTFTYILSK